MNTRFFIDQDGKFIGGFGDGAAPPDEATEVMIAPPDGRALWTGSEWELAAIVPDEVSRFQAKAALANAGLLSQADAIVAASGNMVLQLAWAEATTFQRNSPGIAALAPALGLDAAALDDLFIAAAEIIA